MADDDAYHYHLLIQVADTPLGVFMQRVGSRYARAVQKRMATTGHLFENRYHALLVDVDTYFLELLRYIHLNPVRAGLVALPETYRWSSHGAYLGIRSSGWVHCDFALLMFHADPLSARVHYRQFVEDRIDAPRNQTFYAGHPAEPRVLGDDRFLATLPMPPGLRCSTVTLPEIALAICTELAVSLEELRSVRQHRQLSRARGLIAARALSSRAATVSDIARFLNRERSTVVRAAQRYAGG